MISQILLTRYSVIVEVAADSAIHVPFETRGTNLGSHRGCHGVYTRCVGVGVSWVVKVVLVNQVDTYTAPLFQGSLYFAKASIAISNTLAFGVQYTV